MKRTVLVITGIILSPLWLYLLYGFALVLLGYEVTRDETALAEKLVQEGRSARDCLLLSSIDLGSRPTTQELKASCIHHYAALTKDPTACELLLPSDYGWSCFGSISGPLFAGRPCILFDNNELYCNKKHSEGELRIQNPDFTDCSTFNRDDVRETCHLERTTTLEGTHECHSISHNIMYDRCEFEYAVKMRDAALCAAVRDPARREYCKYYVQLVIKYQ